MPVTGVRSIPQKSDPPPLKRHRRSGNSNPSDRPPSKRIPKPKPKPKPKGGSRKGTIRRFHPVRWKLKRVDRYQKKKRLGWEKIRSQKVLWLTGWSRWRSGDYWREKIERKYHLLVQVTMVNSQSKKGKFTENIQKEEIKEEKLHTSGSTAFMFKYWTHFMGLTPQNVNFLDASLKM